MDPQALIGPSSPLGYPAPYWFLAFFKVLGFVLHMGPMHLWFAGIVVAMVMRRRGGHGRRMSERLMGQMPIIVALGINFGIVPLLFTQVSYYKVFYPATILMAWPWLSVIVMLTFAYYGLYVHAVGIRDGPGRMKRLREVSGWVAAALFVSIGFLFANAFSLMTNVGAWPALWRSTSVAGAPQGVGLNVADPTLWPRWLMMFGLALTTTAAYLVVDAGLFAGRESEEYRRWVVGFAFKLYGAGALWFGVFGSWYVFGTWRPEVRGAMFAGPAAVLTVATALGPALPLALIAARRRATGRGLALATALAQLGVLALNAVSRQLVQNAELRPFLDVTAERVSTQWSPLLLFLVLFASGLAVVVWMVAKVAEAGRRTA